MKGSKTWYESTTLRSAIVGLVIAILALLKALGIQIDIDEGQVTEILGALVLVVSAIVSIYGRIKATQVLKLK